MATENLDNGQGVVVATDTTKPSNAALKAQGWQVEGTDPAVQPSSGFPI